MTALFAIAVFWGAAMLFVVQPLAARLLLPVLGGSPAVWIASMLFFQSALLAGYALAHALVRARHGVRVAVYVGVLLIGCVVLPIGAVTWAAPAPGFEPFWVGGALAWMVGPAFVALAAAGPMLQSWYARSSPRQDREPYALFAASNAGSLIGLLAYPFLVEPMLGLRAQGVAWAVGYLAFIPLAIVCGLGSLRAQAATRERPPREQAPAEQPSEAPDAKRAGAGVWLLWSFAGSSLLLGTTLQMTTDIASVPLLWVVPLSVYLLTFVVAFRPGLRAGWEPKRAPWLVALSVTALSVVMLTEARDPAWAVYAVYLLVLATGAYLCHARLSSARPDASRLTVYYLCIAAGGALGGVFNAIAAPELFNWIAEYPIAVALACAALGRRSPTEDTRPLGPRVGAVMLVAGVFAIWAGLGRTQTTGLLADVLGVGLSALALYALRRDGRLMGGAFVGLALAVVFSATPGAGERVELRERTFFGVTEVVGSANGDRTSLIHGATEHGAEITRDDLAGQPTSYYHPRGPAGDVLGALERWQNDDGASVALVGLGAGSLAAYAEAGDRVDIYEIDPLVVRIAEDPRWFSFLSSARARGVTGQTRIGDGRLGLARALGAESIPEPGYDVIVLDAFTSDAIPPHLLTAEAFEMYARVLAPGGVVLVHISNRYLDLEPVVFGAAVAMDWAAASRWHAGVGVKIEAEGARPSRWIAVARTREDLGFLGVATWIRLDPAHDPSRLWTDDHADLLSVLDLGP